MIQNTEQEEDIMEDEDLTESKLNLIDDETRKQEKMIIKDKKIQD